MKEFPLIRQVTQSTRIAKTSRQPDKQPSQRQKQQKQSDGKQPSFFDFFESEQQQEQDEQRELRQYYRQLQQNTLLQRPYCLQEKDYPLAIHILTRMMKGHRITETEKEYVVKQYPELYLKAVLLQQQSNREK